MSKLLGVAAVLAVICIVNVYSAYTFGGQGYGSSGLFGNGYSGGLYKEYGGLSGLSGGLSGGHGYLSGGFGGYGVKGIPILQIPIVPYKGVRIGKGVAKGFGNIIGTGKAEDTLPLYQQKKFEVHPGANGFGREEEFFI